MDHLSYPAAAEAYQAVGHGCQRGIMGDQKDGDVLFTAGILKELKNLFSCVIIPVSYTHLDVYKRQELCYLVVDGAAAIMVDQKKRCV